MRQIIRLSLDAKILEQLAVKQQNINDGARSKFRLSNPQKREVFGKLHLSQKGLCCYCECEIDNENCHLEHFHERSDQPDKTYDYDNFLLSCQGESTPSEDEETDEERVDRVQNIRCGHGKEESRHNEVAVNYDLLLNPIQNNGTIIRYNARGRLVSRTDVQADIDKVYYTLNRLNLNSQRLINQRRIVIQNTQKNLKRLSEVEQKTYITSLLDDTQTQLPAFHSTIKDNFAFLLQ